MVWLRNIWDLLCLNDFFNGSKRDMCIMFSVYLGVKLVYIFRNVSYIRVNDSDDEDRSNFYNCLMRTIVTARGGIAISRSGL